MPQEGEDARSNCLRGQFVRTHAVICLLLLGILVLDSFWNLGSSNISKYKLISLSSNLPEEFSN